MNRKALLGKALLEVLAEFAVFAALLFVSAGTLLWPAGWAFIAIFFSFAVAIVLWLARKEPELLQERMSSPMQSGQPLWDKVFVVAVLLLFLTWLIVMPLDAVRFGWSEVPEWLQLMGALGSRALVLHHVLDLPGERVSRPGGESSRGEGSERGEHRPVPLREASHVCEHVLVLPGGCTAARFVVGSPALRCTAGSTRLEDPPRRADARERTGRIRGVRTEGEVQAHSPRLVSIRRTARKWNSRKFISSVLHSPLLWGFKSPPSPVEY